MPGSLNKKIEENILSSGGCKSAGAGYLAMKEHGKRRRKDILATDEHGISRKKQKQRHGRGRGIIGSEPEA